MKLFHLLIGFKYNSYMNSVYLVAVHQICNDRNSFCGFTFEFLQKVTRLLTFQSASLVLEQIKFPCIDKQADIGRTGSSPPIRTTSTTTSRLDQISPDAQELHSVQYWPAQTVFPPTCLQPPAEEIVWDDPFCHVTPFRAAPVSLLTERRAW